MATGRPPPEQKQMTSENEHTCNRSVDGKPSRIPTASSRVGGQESFESDTLSRQQHVMEERGEETAQKQRPKRQGSSRTVDNNSDHKLSIDNDNGFFENSSEQSDPIVDGRRHKTTGHRSNTKDYDKKQAVNKQTPRGSLTRQSLVTRVDQIPLSSSETNNSQENIRYTDHDCSF